jgi:hypothetical protein
MEATAVPKVVANLMFYYFLYRVHTANVISTQTVCSKLEVTHLLIRQTLYVQHTTVVRSRNHSSNQNVTVHGLFIVELYVTGNNTTYLGLHVKHKMFLSDFNQI